MGRGRRTGVVLILVAAATWAADDPSSRGLIDACVRARTLAPAEHFKLCAQLLPRCAQGLAVMDGGTLPVFSSPDVAARCGPAYCPGLAPQPRWCTGDVGSPATNFAQEREFIRRALELEHGLRAEEATEAFLEPLRRLLEEADRARRSEDQDIERNTRLQLRIFLEADQVVVRVLDRDGEPLGHWSGREGPSPEHCERMMREALKGQPARPNEWVVIRAQKEVSFKVVKCALNGLARAGFGKKVHFEPWR